jgi:hypothetical protein
MHVFSAVVELTGDYPIAAVAVQIFGMGNALLRSAKGAALIPAWGTAPGSDPMNKRALKARFNGTIRYRRTE